MLSSLKRASYRVIEEEEGENEEMSSIDRSRIVAENAARINLRGNEIPEEEEDEREEVLASLFEPAPPSRHGVAVSFKSGDKDSEMQPVGGGDPCEWDHIKDVDQFFANIYEYYQQKGFTCIVLRSAFSLLCFAFVVLFSTFLFQCVDYDVLFYNRNTTIDGTALPAKRTLHDAFIPLCYARLNLFASLALILATLFWLAQFLRIFYRFVQFAEIRRFFAGQLQISDSELHNLNWSQVVERLCAVQQKLHLIVNRETITPLDVCQRILRHKNYFVALVYYDILPPRTRLPLLGPIHYLSNGLRFNLEWLLFWGPWSPWKGPYALKDEYKDPSMLPTLVRQMQRTLTMMALVNLVFSPFVFVYQLVFSFFSYSEHFQRDSNVFGMRKYSNYGREKIRHFNEMDHELEARLNRSYEFAARYTDQFISPVASIFARNIAFVAASIFVVLCALTAFDEDTLKIEHVTTILSLTGGTVLLCRVFIPNEHLVLCQQLLMRQIVANIHYAPRSWLANAHSNEIHRELTQIFRLKMELLVEELLSPLLCPYTLYFRIWHRVPEIVTFFLERTVTLNGLGDICSLAQMDITSDGDARLISLNHSISGANGMVQKDGDGRCQRRVSCGKVGLSLLNFATQHPGWNPLKTEADFISNVRELVSMEVSGVLENMELQRQLLLRQQQTDESVVMPIFERRNSSALLRSSGIKDGPMKSNEENGEEGTFVGAAQTTSSAPKQRQRNHLTSSANLNESALRGVLASVHPQLGWGTPQNLLIASSFITPNSLANTVQPLIENESKYRATEMSLHALAINHVLALNNNNNPHEHQQQQQQQCRSRYGSTRNNRGGGGGYGTILGESTTEAGILRRIGGGAHSVLDNSLAESNIWGVPANDISRAQMPPTTSGNFSSLLLTAARHGGKREAVEVAELKQMPPRATATISAATTTAAAPSSSNASSITAPPPPPLRPL